MQKNRIIITILIVGLIGIGWFSKITSTINRHTNYQENLAEADKCFEAGLYQKAIALYEEILSLGDKEDILQKWISAKEMALKDGTESSDGFSKALAVMCEKYPDEAVYWEKLLDNYLTTNNYKEAYSAYTQLLDTEAHSDYLKELGLNIKYSYNVMNKAYSKVYASPTGYFAVCNDDKWGVMDPAGEWIKECEYQYISPTSNKGMALYKSDRGSRLIDNASVVQVIVEQDFSEARACYGDMLPLYVNDKWEYINCETGASAFGDFDDASCYTNGIAAVKKSNKWSLINLENEMISEVQFDDIKLYGNGEYTYAKKMIAAINGKYGLYDKNGKIIADFAAQDADVYMGDLIAFQGTNGKWGFVNVKGEVIIEPCYDAAKSFSNGLAAVRNQNKWGYINKEGDVAIDYQFVEAGYFTKEGVAFVSTLEDSYQAIKLRF